MTGAHPDPMRLAAAPHRATSAPIEIVGEVEPFKEPESMQSHPQTNVAESWSRLEAWLQARPHALPGGLNAPASNDAIVVLEGALGAKLPNDLIASLKTHDGQADQGGVCFDGETLLNAQGILEEWTCWRDLVVEGTFDDMTSDPDGGVKDDWYNLRWIPVTKNGSGDCLCVDLDPAPGGTYGQVIRMWHDDDRRERVAASYEAWLRAVVTETIGLLEVQKE